MDFKCLECGHVFPGSDVSHWRESHGERMTGCPLCRGAFEEVVHCRECGGYFLEDELYEGFCKACLVESMTHTNLLLYMAENDLEWNFYANFLFDRDDLLCFLRHVFSNMIKEDKIYKAMGRRWPEAQELCIEFVTDGVHGLRDYAEWYNEQK